MSSSVPSRPYDDEQRHEAKQSDNTRLHATRPYLCEDSIYMYGRRDDKPTEPNNDATKTEQANRPTRPTRPTRPHDAKLKVEVEVDQHTIKLNDTCVPCEANTGLQTTNSFPTLKKPNTNALLVCTLDLEEAAIKAVIVRHDIYAQSSSS